jgi:O-6-methylguanine DNA methyltransferase
MTESLFYTTHDSTIGKLLLVASARGVRYISLLEANENAEDRLAKLYGATQASTVTELPGFFGATIQAIDNYLDAGTPLNLPLDLAGGTALQRSVWFEIAKIPYGETISYSTLAERVGFPRAVRAVASACGANPIPLGIPCHRVLAKDGSLGGFSLGGLEVKEYLLLTESRQYQAAVA